MEEGATIVGAPARIAKRWDSGGFFELTKCIVYIGDFDIRNENVQSHLVRNNGKIFNELVKGNDTRKQFFEKIIEVQTLLGGDLNDVI